MGFVASTTFLQQGGREENKYLDTPLATTSGSGAGASH